MHIYTKIYDKNELSKGQGTVEYLLLLVVVMSLVFTLVNSPLFQNILGNDSSFFVQLKEQQEYNFRHTHYRAGPDDSSYDGDHHSYVNPDSGGTRFFSTDSAYPP